LPACASASTLLRQTLRPHVIAAFHPGPSDPAHIVIAGEGLPPEQRGRAILALGIAAVGLATLDTAIANTALPAMALTSTPRLQPRCGSSPPISWR
jgi:hypothetical protein